MYLSLLPQTLRAVFPHLPDFFEIYHELNNNLTSIKSFDDLLSAYKRAESEFLPTSEQPTMFMRLLLNDAELGVLSRSPKSTLERNKGSDTAVAPQAFCPLISNSSGSSVVISPTDFSAAKIPMHRVVPVAATAVTLGTAQPRPAHEVPKGIAGQDFMQLHMGTKIPEPAKISLRR